MRTVADISREDLEHTLVTEIAQAREVARPVSRLTLTRLLQSQYSLHPHEAERFVDQYCDDKAPAVPTYLSDEFGVPYLKIIGSVQLVIAAGFYIFPLIFPRADLTFWPAMILGTIFAGLGGFCIYRTLQPKKEPPAMVRLSNELPKLGVKEDPAEPAATGSLQSRS